jgi:Tol biopolymer transport system component
MRGARFPRIVGLALVLALAAGCDFVVRASVDTSGGDPNSDSLDSSISADGRYVAFWSAATDLVPNDHNGAEDVFVRDLRTNTTVRASVDTAGGDANGDSFFPTINADGRYVAFASRATDLVAGGAGAGEDIFVRDLQANVTTRVTVDAGGGNANAPTRMSRISGDGRHVVFASAASDLVGGDGNGTEDVFVRDLDVHTTTRASVDTANGDANGNSGSTTIFSPPAIDADGSRVVFFSNASDLVPADGNGLSDMFVRNLSAGTTTRVSVDTAGGDANGPSDEGGGRPSITADGNVVAFASFASDLATADANGAGSDVFVRDLTSSTTTLASGDSLGGSGPSISDDGRFVSYQTTQIFVHDRTTGATVMASAKFGRPANGISGAAAISADGRYVAFHTNADNLLGGDHNRSFDVYVRAVSIPRVRSITPNTVAAGTSATLTVIGSNFLPGTIAAARALPGDLQGVTVDAVTVVSETELEVAITVDPGAPTGPRTILVWTPGTGPGAPATTFALCNNCLTIT